MLGTGADADIFGEVFPADGAGAVEEELGGTGDVGGFRAGSFMQEIVAANDFRVWIGEKRKGVALLGAEMFGNGGRVHTDSHGADALGGELGELVLDASQLEVAEGSPVAAVEDEQDGLGRRSARRGGEELREGDGLAGAIGQSEVRYALADLRGASGARDAAGNHEEQN